jgi:gluconate:H+ symporter, GntP family
LNFHTWLLVETLLAVVGLMVLIAGLKLNSFIALALVSLLVGLGAGLPIARVAASFERGVGEMLGLIAMVIALGAVLGKMLEVSGGAQRLGSILVGLCGQRGLPIAMVLVALLVGFPVFFAVGLVLLMPIVTALSQKSGKRLSRLGLPLVAGLSVSHGLIPPHPGPMAAVATLHADVGKTILYALCIGLPIALVVGVLFSLFDLGEDPPPSGEKSAESPVINRSPERIPATSPNFWLVLFTLLLPVMLMLVRTVAELALPETDRLRSWAMFFGDPTVALLVTVLFSFWSLGFLSGIGRERILALSNECLTPVAGILLVVAAGGGLKQVLLDGGIGEAIRESAEGLKLSPLLLGWLVAAAIRVATGSATVAVSTAAALVLPLAGDCSRELLVVSLGAGSLVVSHVNDGGFWLVKEYLRLTVPQTMLTWTIMETLISLLGLGGVLLLASWVS